MSTPLLPGLYKTLGGTVYFFNGSLWTPFKPDFSQLDEDWERYEQPEPEMIKIGTETERLALIKAWWSKNSRIEGVDWNAMIDLADILMKED